MLLVLVVFFSCKKDAEQPQFKPYRISGVFIEQRTKKPIDSVAFQLIYNGNMYPTYYNGMIYYSDSLGNFSVLVNIDKDITFTPWKSGYKGISIVPQPTGSGIKWQNGNQYFTITMAKDTTKQGV